MHLVRRDPTPGPLDEAVAAALTDRFLERLWDKDPTLWGPDAVAESSIRLGWLEDPALQGGLVDDVLALRAELSAAGIHRVILCGMGGSSLAPEVMARAAGVPLTVVDTIHPDVLAPLLRADLTDAVVVVSSKSGGTVETDSQRRVFEAALAAQGLDPRRHLVVVTDPDSPLDHSAAEAGYRVFHGNPHVGGRFSALTAFGLVPSGLAGVPIRKLITEGHEAWAALAQPHEGNEGLILGAALATGAPARNKVLVGDPATMPGLGNWIEQLVAESTGKDGKGVLPVVGSSLASTPDSVSIGPAGSGADVVVEGKLGELFFLWEVATAFACQLLGVNPFDQPNVESAKIAARELLSSGVPDVDDELAVEGVRTWASPAVSPGVSTVSDSLRSFFGHLTPSSYVALCVFGPGGADEGSWRTIAHALESHTNRPAVLGFGPRFLHSTGQYHKGGPHEGLFLQVIMAPSQDIAIPGRDFAASDLLRAQAHGDASVLSATGQPVLSLTLTGEEHWEVFRQAVVKLA